MQSANEWLQAELIRHAVLLQQLGNHVVQRMVAVLNRSDARLFATLIDELAKVTPSPETVGRLTSMLDTLRVVNAAAYRQLGREFEQELRHLTEYEADYQRQLLEDAAPDALPVAAVNAQQAYVAALARPFQGHLLRDVLSDMEAGRAKKIRQALAQGFVEGKASDALVRELRGTKARNFEDGLLEGSRRDVAAVVRTAMGHFAGMVADRSMQANGELVKAVQWVSTLDLRTSAPCRLRDGLQYTPGSHKPIGHFVPWGAGPGRLHWCCRSHQVPVLKSWRELGIDIDEMPEGTRATLDGQVPAAVTYPEWLAKQPAGRQDEVLGPTRGKLFRQGGLPLEQLYTRKGEFRTLDELRRLDAVAFKRAGV